MRRTIVENCLLGMALLGLSALPTPTEPPRRLVGVTVASADLQISCEESGLIARMPVREGQKVKRGELLFSLASAAQRIEVERLALEAASEVSLRAAQAELRAAEREEARHEALERRGISKEKDLDFARREAELARIKLQQAKTEQRLAALRHQEAKARLEARSVRSPIDGVVVERLHSVGEAVERWTPVLQVMQVQPMWVEFDCPVAELGPFVKGRRLHLSQAESGLRGRAVVLHRSAEVDAASQTVRVRLQIDPVEPAWPAGLKVYVEVPSEGGK